MAIRVRATEAQIKAIQPGLKERLESDELVPNLYLVVSPKGKKTWRWIATLKDKSARKMTLGVFPALGLVAARDQAREYNTIRENGGDPKLVVAEQGETTPVAAIEAETVEAIFGDWLAEKRRVGRAAKSVHEYERLMRRNFVDAYGSRILTSITKQDVRDALKVIADRGTVVTGNRFLIVLKSFFEWCVHEDHMTENVAAKVAFVKEPPRPDRVLSLYEMALAYRAADHLEPDERDALRLLVLTGTRMMESLGARSSDFDVETGVWTLPIASFTDERGHTFPVSHAKFDREHYMLLPPLARSIFEERKSRTYLFHRQPHKYMMSDLASKTLAAMEKMGGKTIDHWTLHKIRKGFRTGLSSDEMDEMLEREGNGEVFSENVGEIATQHSLGGLNRTYNKSRYTRAVGRALAAWERLLREELDRQGSAFEGAKKVDDRPPLRTRAQSAQTVTCR